MPEVVIHDDESFERALKRFKKKCEQAGALCPTCASIGTSKSPVNNGSKMSAAVRKTRRGPRAPRV